MANTFSTAPAYGAPPPQQMGSPSYNSGMNGPVYGHPSPPSSSHGPTYGGGMNNNMNMNMNSGMNGMNGMNVNVGFSAGGCTSHSLSSSS